MEIAAVLQAAQFAAERHKNQRRKDADASPYINHPIALANVLATEGGVVDPDVLCAALLHDTIEDTETTAEELRRDFGKRVTAIVLEVTDDKSLPKTERKRFQVERAYFDWASDVVDGVRGVHPGLEAVFDGLLGVLNGPGFTGPSIVVVRLGIPGSCSRSDWGSVAGG